MKLKFKNMKEYFEQQYTLQLTRICYGEKEPKHLDKTAYYFDKSELIYFESDKAFKKRILENVKTNNQ